MKHSIKFEDGTIITSYLAVAYAEGFFEGEEASPKDILHAWSYIIGNKLYLGLQGWFGRTVQDYIDNDIIDENGIINWDNV